MSNQRKKHTSSSTQPNPDGGSSDSNTDVRRVRKRKRPVGPAPLPVSGSHSSGTAKAVGKRRNHVDPNAKNSSSDRETATSSATTQGDYEVGYKRPPEEHQFKPGQSGNPKGRPKRAKNTKTIADELLNQKLEIKLGGKPKKVTAREAAIYAILQKTLKGDVRAFKQILDLDPRNTDEPLIDSSKELPLSALEREIIKGFLNQKYDGGEDDET